MTDATIYSIPYSKTEIEFNLLPGMRGTVVVSKKAEPLADVKQAIAETLDNPIGTPPLREMAKPGDRVCRGTCPV